MWGMNGHIVVMKLPITSCPLLRPSEHLNSFWGRVFKLNAKFDADSLLYLLSHFECDSHTCSLNSIYHPHWPVQWSHHCSCMCILVHSPWLPGYIDSRSCKPFSLYSQWLDFSWTDLYMYVIHTHTHSCIYIITYIICIIIIIVCNNYILFLRNISEFIVVVSLSYYFK